MTQRRDHYYLEQPFEGDSNDCSKGRAARSGATTAGVDATLLSQNTGTSRDAEGPLRHDRVQQLFNRYTTSIHKPLSLQQQQRQPLHAGSHGVASQGKVHQLDISMDRVSTLHSSGIGGGGGRRSRLNELPSLQLKLDLDAAPSTLVSTAAATSTSTTTPGDFVAAGTGQRPLQRQVDRQLTSQQQQHSRRSALSSAQSTSHPQPSPPSVAAATTAAVELQPQPERQRSRRQPPRSTTQVKEKQTVDISAPTTPPVSRLPSLPSRDAARWLQCLCGLVARVWAPLGLLSLSSSSAASTEDMGSVGNDAYDGGGGSGGGDDVEPFIQLLRRYYAFQGGEPDDGAGGEEAKVVRNGLWRMLYNASFFCMNALDTQGGASRNAAAYKRVRGPEDDDDDDCTSRVCVPVPLSWRDGSATSGGDDSRVSAQQRSRSFSRGGRSNINNAECATSFCDMSPLHVLDWYVVLRFMASTGYGRDVFYTQTATQASPHELLLALVWLTRHYQLIAVAEYVELDRRYGFLLETRASDSPWRALCTSAPSPTPGECGSVQDGLERLLLSFPGATTWPPVSYDEVSTIAMRLGQIERIMGPDQAASGDGDRRFSFAEDDGDVEGGASPPRRSHGTTIARRIMALRRLITLSLNRLEHALKQRAEQAEILGVHSSLDAQLCQRRHHTLYERLVAGLEYVVHTEERVRSASECLAGAASLAGYAVRYWSDAQTIPEEELRLAREEDSRTWLARKQQEEGGEGSSSLTDCDLTAVHHSHDAGSGSGPSTTFLSSVLSKFRAVRTREHLRDLWATVLRRAQVGGGGGGRLVSAESEEFLRSPAAQAAQEAQVRTNIRYRYSLHAALAAELYVMKQRPACGSGGDLSTERLARRRTQPTARRHHARALRSLIPVTLTTAMATQQSGCCGVQYTDVGEPQPGSTTSARVEHDRLEAIRRKLASQPEVREGAMRRVGACEKALRDLSMIHGLRIVTMARKTTVAAVATQKGEKEGAHANLKKGAAKHK